MTINWWCLLIASWLCGKPFGKCSYPKGYALPKILTSCSNSILLNWEKNIFILNILLERINLNRSVVKVAQNVTDLEQRVEVLEVEVANIEDDINDIETDLDLQTTRISHVEDDVSQNTIQIFGILFRINLVIGMYNFFQKKQQQQQRIFYVQFAFGFFY